METVAFLLEFKQNDVEKSPALSSPGAPLRVCPPTPDYKAYFPPNFQDYHRCALWSWSYYFHALVCDTSMGLFTQIRGYRQMSVFISLILHVADIIFSSLSLVVELKITPLCRYRLHIITPLMSFFFHIFLSRTNSLHLVSVSVVHDLRIICSFDPKQYRQASPNTEMLSPCAIREALFCFIPFNAQYWAQISSLQYDLPDLKNNICKLEIQT